VPIVLNMRAAVHTVAGQFSEAGSLCAEAQSVSEATGSSMAPCAAVGLAAIQGREAETAAPIEAGTKDAERRARARR
jgi:Zn-dependent alcohol dehydrogenase